MSNGYNFSERVRACLALAREESHALHHEYVGTEHILLGMIRDGEGVAIACLQTMGVDPAKLRAELIENVKVGKTPEAGEFRGADLPYTSRAKKVLELAMAEALYLSHSYVGTEHLLLGLVREERGIAAQVLRHNGADLERVRTEVLSILGPASATPSEFPNVPGRGIASSGISSEASDRPHVESVTVKIRYTDGSFVHEVFRDVQAAQDHLAKQTRR